MNLLLLLPGRFLYYKDSNIFESYLPVPQSSAEQILQILEHKEEELAQQANPEKQKPPPFLSLETENFSDSAFWRTVFQGALEEGHLLVHSFANNSVVPEHFQTKGVTWISSFVIHYAQACSEPFLPAQSRKKKVFIYFNPGGKPLPEAKKEACRVAGLMENQTEFRISLRSLSEFELREQITDSDAFFYFGHARFREGCPLIPCGDAWIPLLVAGLPVPRLLFLASCLPTRGLPLKLSSESSIYPNCRIADRPNSFAEDFCQSWLQGHSVGQSFLAACRSDEEKGDIRRYVYRLQGKN